MSWRRFTALVAGLPPVSWWQRLEHPPSNSRTSSGGRSGGGGVVEIDARRDPDKARGFFASIAPPKRMNGRKATA